MRLSAEALAGGYSLRHVPSIGSTNSAALEAVEAGRDRHWVVADMQVSGRGRHGRAWASPAGNLHASLGLLAPCPVPEAPRLGFVAGLSLVEAIVEATPALLGKAKLKWPNDCLVDGAKCAGILAEGAMSPAGVQRIAIGIGVNVAHVPEGLGQQATCLAAHDPGIGCERFFEVLSERMSANLAIFSRGTGFAEIRRLWLAHALPMGERLRVRLPRGARHGVFAGIDDAGHLLLGTDHGVETILVGDVFLVGDKRLDGSDEAVVGAAERTE